MLNDPPWVGVQPPLQRSERAFLRSFAGDGGLRRVWPGQPSATSPWWPSDDGCRLDLDAERASAAPEKVVTWLRFLSREFLAPSTSEALEAALNAGLRGGHRLSGSVVIEGQREIVVANNRITERIVASHSVGVVLDLRHRPQITEL